MRNPRSIKRETQALVLANLASRVAAAARRAADGRPISAEWQFKALAEAEERLRNAADTLRDGHEEQRYRETDNNSYAADDNSYALAQLTHSAMVQRSSPPNISDDEIQERMTKTMIRLADNIGIIRNQDDSAERRDTANELNEVFKRVSAVALTQFGSPGDTLGEIIKGTATS